MTIKTRTRKGKRFVITSFAEPREKGLSKMLSEDQNHLRRHGRKKKAEKDN